MGVRCVLGFAGSVLVVCLLCRLVAGLVGFSFVARGCLDCGYVGFVSSCCFGLT